MKLYVSTINEIINQERAQSILRDVGITKKIDGFSDCKNNCCCNSFNDGLEIRFDSFRMMDRFSSKLKRIFLTPIINLFIKNPDERFIEYHHKICGFFEIENEKKMCIRLFLDIIFEFNQDIKRFLIHELMHIKKPLGHCDKPLCIFYHNYEKPKDKFNQVLLCEDCQKNFNKILEEINND